MMSHKNHHKTNRPKEKPEAPSRREFLKALPYVAGGIALSAAGYLSYTHTGSIEPLTFSSLEEIPGVRSVYDTHGEQPEVIYLPYSHPSSAVSVKTSRDRDVPAIEKICNHLYKHNGVRSILIEGLEEELVKIYRQTGKIEVDSGNRTPQGIEDDQIISRMLSTHQWNLQLGEDRLISSKLEELRMPLVRVTEEFSRYLEQRVNRLNEEVSQGRIQEDQLVRQAEKDMEAHRKIALDKIDKYLTRERVSQYGGLVVTQRNNHVRKKAIACKNNGKSPLIVIYGDNHGKELAKLFRSQGIGYALLLPEGYSSNLPDIDPNEAVKGIFNIPPISLRSN